MSPQWLPLVLVVGACAGPSPEVTQKPFDIVVRATTDDGQPMPQVRFSIGEATLGTTDSNGALTTTIRGAEGQTVTVAASCPPGYTAPDDPTRLRLTEVRRVDATGPQALSVDVTCTRKMRDVLLVVRASDAPLSPIDVLGKTIGQTDQNGIAHFKLQLEREVRSLSVSLRTAGLPQLRPQNPSRVFELDAQDAVVLMDQSFSIERPPKLVPRKLVVKHEAPKPIPYRVDLGSQPMRNQKDGKGWLDRFTNRRSPPASDGTKPPSDALASTALPSEELQRFRRGELTEEQYLEARIIQATLHLRGRISNRKLERIRATVSRVCRTDPVLLAMKERVLRRPTRTCKG